MLVRTAAAQRPCPGGEFGDDGGARRGLLGARHVLVPPGDRRPQLRGDLRGHAARRDRAAQPRRRADAVRAVGRPAHQAAAAAQLRRLRAVRRRGRCRLPRPGPARRPRPGLPARPPGRSVLHRGHHRLRVVHRAGRGTHRRTAGQLGAGREHDLRGRQDAGAGAGRRLGPGLRDPAVVGRGAGRLTDRRQLRAAAARGPRPPAGARRRHDAAQAAGLRRHRLQRRPVPARRLQHRAADRAQHPRRGPQRLLLAVLGDRVHAVPGRVQHGQFAAGGDRPRPDTDQRTGPQGAAAHRPAADRRRDPPRRRRPLAAVGLRRRVRPRSHRGAAAAGPVRAAQPAAQRGHRRGQGTPPAGLGRRPAGDAVRPGARPDPPADPPLRPQRRRRRLAAGRMRARAAAAADAAALAALPARSSR